DEAGRLALAEDLERVPMDAAWPGAMIGWAEGWSALGLRDRAAETYELMAPYARQLASGGSLFFGTLDWALAQLAPPLERPDQAEEHCAGAAAIDERLGAPLFLARTNADWAGALIARGRPEDLDRITPMLEQAEGAARRAGAAGILATVAECRSALAHD